MGDCETDAATILLNETNFFTWVAGDQSCPPAEDVYTLLQTYIDTDSNPNNTLYYLRDQINSLKTAIANRQLDTQVAHDRANMVTRPELTASYYDSWFPLNRPLRHISVPILIGFATLLFTLALILLLELFGIRIMFSVFTPTEALLNSTKYTKPFWIMAIIAGIFVALTLYLFLR